MQMQIERKKTPRHGDDEAGRDDGGQIRSTSSSDKLVDEMDEILDEIDAVLETNAEEFVKSYIQKGGE
ncbi:MAG: ubiquitin-like protein Pup [Actinomycetota bacterium]